MKFKIIINPAKQKPFNNSFPINMFENSVVSVKILSVPTIPRKGVVF